MYKIKQALKSRTIKLAILQAVVSLLCLIFTEADMFSAALAIKSIADIYLRADTKVPVLQK